MPPRTPNILKTHTPEIIFWHDARMEEHTVGDAITDWIAAVPGRRQEDIAEFVNVKQGTVSKWRHDQLSPKVASRPRLAMILGVTEVELDLMCAATLRRKARRDALR